MDDIQVFGSNAAKVRLELYTEILESDRSAKSLMEQGFSRSDVRYSLNMLVKEGLIYKYGNSVNTYFSVNKYDDDAKPTKLNQIKIPEHYANNFNLAFLMGYTNIPAAKGRMVKEII
jgi:hypothetical protein